MTFEPDSKRRKIAHPGLVLLDDDTQDLDASNPLIAFSLPHFRKRLCCFLMTTTRRGRRQPGTPRCYVNDLPKDEYGRDYTAETISNIDTILSRPSSDRCHDQIDDTVKRCLSSTNSHLRTICDEVTRVDGLSAQEKVGQLLLSRTRTNLTVFFRHFCTELPGYSSSLLSTTQSLARALSVLFQTGKLPGTGNEEGHSAAVLSVEFCGFLVPRDVVVLILSFRGYDYASLTSVGLANSSMFKTMMQTWKGELIVDKRKSLTIPETIFSVVPSVVLRKGLVVKEVKRIAASLGRNSLESLRFDIGFSLEELKRYVRSFWASVCSRSSSPFRCLRKVSFRFCSEIRRENFDMVRPSLDLKKVAPSLEIVEFPPCFEMLKGLTKLVDLSIFHALLPSFPKWEVKILQNLIRLYVQYGSEGFSMFPRGIKCIFPGLGKLRSFSLHGGSERSRERILRFLGRQNANLLEELSLSNQTQPFEVEYEAPYLPNLRVARFSAREGLDFKWPTLEYQPELIEPSWRTLEVVELTVLAATDFSFSETVKTRLTSVLNRVGSLKELSIRTLRCRARVRSRRREVHFVMGLRDSKVKESYDWVVGEIISRCRADLRFFILERQGFSSEHSQQHAAVVEQYRRLAELFGRKAAFRFSRKTDCFDPRALGYGRTSRFHVWRLYE